MVMEPVVLEGRHVRLEPLALEHAAALWAASVDPQLHRYRPWVMRSEEDLRQFIALTQRQHAADQGLSFVTIARDRDEIVGSSSFMAADWPHRRVEIGATWITTARQRTAINTEAKYLMLRHAFEALGLLRVEFKTDSLNARSRAALLRIGATEEGTLRNHMVMPDGRRRHSVYFSIIAEEWPAVKARLEGFLAARERAETPGAQAPG
jgi:RimJ/RimL family protein N-acetyltransferase